MLRRGEWYNNVDTIARVSRRGWSGSGSGSCGMGGAYKLFMDVLAKGGLTAGLF